MKMIEHDLGSGSAGSRTRTVRLLKSVDLRPSSSGWPNVVTWCWCQLADIASFFYEQCDWKKIGLRIIVTSWMRRPAIGSQSHYCCWQHGCFACSKVFASLFLPCNLRSGVRSFLVRFIVNEVERYQNHHFLKGMRHAQQVPLSIYAISSENIQTSTMPRSTWKMKEEGGTQNDQRKIHANANTSETFEGLAAFCCWCGDVFGCSSQSKEAPFVECMSDIKRRFWLSRCQTFVD